MADQIGRLTGTYGGGLCRTQIAGQSGYVVGSEYARTAAPAGYPRDEIDPVRFAVYDGGCTTRRGKDAASKLK